MHSGAKKNRAAGTEKTRDQIGASLREKGKGKKQTAER